MKQSEAKDFLPLIQAWAEGKTLQLKPKDSDLWLDINERADVLFAYGAKNYRIKPEPRTFYAVEFDDGSVGFVCATKEKRDSFNSRGWGKSITLMEVLDD